MTSLTRRFQPGRRTGHALRGGAVALQSCRPLALLASALLLLPLSVQAFPGRGAGGGFGGDGGYHFGGGATGGGGDWRSGYQGSHPWFGSGTRPAWGGGDGGAGGSFGGGSFGGGNRFNGDNSGRININSNNNYYNRNFNDFNDNWRNGGYWNNRPWGAGWFVGGANTWGWYGANAAAWGLAGLATGAAIGSLVNTAAAQSSPVFLVPQTSYLLNYGSVEAVGSYGVSFNYLVNGTQLLGAANCQQGLLNGQVPANGDQAQLLNAVCQVAYGSGS